LPDQLVLPIPLPLYLEQLLYDLKALDDLLKERQRRKRLDLRQRQ